MASLLVCAVSACDPYEETLSLGEVKATQYSRGELADRIRSCVEGDVAAFATSVNRNDHPWIVDVLAEEVLRLVGERRIERAAAMVDAVAWCGWDRLDRVHELAVDLVHGGSEEQRLAVRLLQLSGRAEHFGVLDALARVQDPGVALKAREGLGDLFGFDGLGGAAPTQVVPGSTCWILSRLFELRRHAVTSDQGLRKHQVTEALWKQCPEERRPRMARLVLASCLLPLEEFPGAGDLEEVGVGAYARSWLGRDGRDLFWAMARYWEATLVGLSRTLFNSGTSAEREAFWRLLADPLVGDAKAAQELYDQWVERDMTKDEAFYFLSACAQRQIEVRSPRELGIAAALDWEERLDERYLVHAYASYLTRVMGPVGAAIHADHLWSETCPVDVAALRDVVSRDYVWDRASGRFVADD